MSSPYEPLTKTSLFWLFGQLHGRADTLPAARRREPHRTPYHKRSLSQIRSTSALLDGEGPAVDSRFTSRGGRRRSTGSLPPPPARVRSIRRSSSRAPAGRHGRRHPAHLQQLRREEVQRRAGALFQGRSREVDRPARRTVPEPGAGLGEVGEGEPRRLRGRARETGGTWYLYYGGADKCVGLATCRAGS